MTGAIRRLAADRGRLLVVVAMAAAALIYLPTLGRGLVNLDDHWLVRDNWVVRDASLHSLRTIFFDLDLAHRFTLAPEYLPVRDVSVMLDFAIWGDAFGGHHLTNLVLYVAAIPLWFAVLVGFGIERRLAGLAMLVWALHPSHAESVAWLSERKGVLGMLFVGACGLGYVRFRAGRPPRWLVLAVTCAVCAVWSKALAAFALAGLAGLELALPALRVSWRRSLVGLGAIAIVGGLAFVPVVMLASSSSVVGTQMQAPAGRIPMALGTMGLYTELAVAARANAVAYPISTAGPSAFEIGLGAVALAAIVAALAWRRSPVELRGAAALWSIGWLPISHLVLPLQMVFVADRYLLFPTLGFALAVAFGITRLANTRVRTLLATAIVLALAARAVDAQQTWRDSETLWQRAVASDPGDGEAWSMYAQAVVERGDDARAEAIVATGLVHTQSPRLRYRQALLVLGHGDRDEAVALMRAAAVAGEPRAMASLALLLLDDGKLADARSWAERAVAAAPSYVNGQRALGKVVLAANDPARALTAFTVAYELEPHNLANRYNLALALVALHRPAEARAHLEACLADPGFVARARALLDSMR